MPYGPLISLTGDQAVQLGEQIIADEQAICDGLAEKLIARFDGNLIEIEGRKEDGRLDFNYGVIIDLQNMIFETDKYRHRTRMCVTVCQHGTKSKIWFRTQCIMRRTGPDAGWMAPIHFDGAELEVFFAEAEKLSDVALSALQESYDELLQPYAPTEADQDPAHLSVANVFEFKTFDSDSDKLPWLFHELKHGASFTGTLIDSMSQTGHTTNPAMVAVKLALSTAVAGANATDKDVLEDLKTKPGFSIVDHASAFGDFGVFVQKTVSTELSKSDNRFFAGATYDPDAHVPEKNNADSPAYRVAAEMLATVTDSV
ncbi:hypothetical protein DD563_02775 [Pelagicola sp. LXJ1103]|nr:hypothetical protein DD563_02775 [Pelagicola sp. LXJ1103]